MSSRLPLLLPLLASILLSLGLRAEFGDPRGFLQNQVVTETVLSPGVKLYRADGSHLGQPQVTHVVAVDLTIPNLTLQALPGERFVGSTQFFRRSLVPQMLEDNNALVAINTAFFDIGSTQAPLGLLMRDGVLLREPNAGYHTLAFSRDRQVQLTNFGLENQIIFGGTPRNLAGTNRNLLSNNQIVAYLQPWDRSPGTSAAFTSGLDITEVVVRRTSLLPGATPGAPTRLLGQVIAIRENQPSRTIGADEFILTAAGTARPFLQQMTVGSTVEWRWRLTGDLAWLEGGAVTEAVAGWHRLIIDGVRQSNTASAHWTALHPRSAVGLSADKSRMIILLVEGRQTGRAAGMSLQSIALYLEHLGAFNALEFDGGGSSALAARVDGASRLINTPSDGSQRNVPAGLGVVLLPESPHPFFQNIRVTPAHDQGSAMISWETTAPTLSHAIFGSEGYDRRSPPSAQPTTRHSALITGLRSPGTTFFRLVADGPHGKVTSHGLEILVGEITMDDPEAQFTGTWSLPPSPFGTPWGPSYHFVGTVAGTATHTATFRPIVDATGTYDVYVWFVPGTNRPAAAQYRIQHSTGTSSHTMNQTTNGNQWRLLASNVHFTAGGDQHVQVLNSAGEGGKFVMVDGIRLVLKQAAPRPAGSLPRWWMRHFFAGASHSPQADLDGDGRTLWEEFLWTTDPTDPQSRPRLSLEPVGGGWRAIFTPFHEGRRYTLQGRASLVEANWNSLTTLPAPSRDSLGRGVIEIPASSPHRFFRLHVAEP